MHGLSRYPRALSLLEWTDNQIRLAQQHGHSHLIFAYRQRNNYLVSELFQFDMSPLA